MDKMIGDRKIRAEVTKQSHYMFFHFYFAHYVKHKTAIFQKELFRLTEQTSASNLFVVAFRGSGKSTIFTMSYPIWAILGTQQKKFVLVLCQTLNQAKQHMTNLKRELENNQLLKNDLGPFQEENNEWGVSSLVFSNMNARITAASTEQSIRGLRHNQYRPDLIICDDIEDISSTKTKEGRNKTYQWLTAEVIPAGDRNTRLIIVGNLLHEDSILMRIKEDVDKKRIDGMFREYPLLKGREILWPGKYPTMQDVESEKRKAGNEFAWEREYMLRIIPAEEQAIHREWIQFYDELPHGEVDWQGYSKNIEIRIGVDLAISKRDTADYTAMVPVLLYGESDDLKMYILPKIVNKKMTFPETVDLCKTLYESYYKKYEKYPHFVIEDVAYQRSLPQQLENEGIQDVKTTRPGNQDKRTRIVLTAHAVKNGKVLFPKEGCEELINQIVHFGVEAHDDLADAFSNAILDSLENPPTVPRVYFI